MNIFYNLYDCTFQVINYFFSVIHDVLNRFYFLEIPSCVDQATTTILNASYSVQTFESHPEFSTSQNYNKYVLRSVFLQLVIFVLLVFHLLLTATDFCHLFPAPMKYHG